jgi:hypothetical protein
MRENSFGEQDAYHMDARALSFSRFSWVSPEIVRQVGD